MQYLPIWPNLEINTWLKQLLGSHIIYCGPESILKVFLMGDLNFSLLYLVWKNIITAVLIAI
jgi:hypothetical protein